MSAVTIIGLLAGLVADHGRQGRICAALYLWLRRAELGVIQIRLTTHERAIEHLRACLDRDDRWHALVDRDRPEQAVAATAPIALRLRLRADDCRRRIAWHEEQIRRLRQDLVERMLELGETPPLPAQSGLD